VQPADIAIELRPRTPWEAIDLGVAMLQRWWRGVYGAQAIIVGLAALPALALAVAYGKPVVAFLALWWLKPLYDRLLLHVLSRAVFGEIQGTRAVFRQAREWLGTGLLWALTLGRLDTARSFTLPVRQLEGSRGAEGRARRSILGRRTRGNAVWLTVVCVHFEAIVYWSLQLLVSMALPAKALEGREFFDILLADEGWAYGHILAYAVAVILVEPLYVAGGFALYLNRRTLLEGWDLEVALRRLAERHAAIAALVILSVVGMLQPSPCYAQKDPKQEIAEVLKSPEFPREVEVMRWVPRDLSRDEKKPAARDDSLVLALARAVQILLWIAAIGALGWALWWLARMVPRLADRPLERYEAPKALFGLELAPESLPPDVPQAVSDLLNAGKMREALALLYRASLSRLMHERGVELRASHTEAEVLALAPSPYLRSLIGAWSGCAYANRLPERAQIEALAQGYAAP